MPSRRPGHASKGLASRTGRVPRRLPGEYALSTLARLSIDYELKLSLADCEDLLNVMIAFA